MRAQNSIQDNFKYFYIYEYEARINQKMHDANEWLFKHFLLAKGKEQYPFPSSRCMYYLYWACEMYCFCNATKSSGDEIAHAE